MKKLVSTFALKREEKEEIDRIFECQSIFLKGLIAFTVLQFTVLFVLL